MQNGGTGTRATAYFDRKGECVTIGDEIEVIFGVEVAVEHVCAVFDVIMHLRHGLPVPRPRHTRLDYAGGGDRTQGRGELVSPRSGGSLARMLESKGSVAVAEGMEFIADEERSACRAAALWVLRQENVLKRRFDFASGGCAHGLPEVHHERRSVIFASRRMVDYNLISGWSRTCHSIYGWDTENSRDDRRADPGRSKP